MIIARGTTVTYYHPKEYLKISPSEPVGIQLGIG